MNIVLLLTLIFSSIKATKSKEPPPKFLVRPNAIYCVADNKTILTKYCFLKPYSRYLLTANLGFKFLEPLNKPFYIQLLIYYRYGTIFRQVIDSKQNEWCSFMEGTDTFPLLKSIVVYINSTFPQLIHKCPYKGELDLFNYTLSAGLPIQSQIFPQGYYKLVIIVHKNNKEAVTVKIRGEITSVLKESYG